MKNLLVLFYVVCFVSKVFAQDTLEMQFLGKSAKRSVELLRSLVAMPQQENHENVEELVRYIAQPKELYEFTTDKDLFGYLELPEDNARLLADALLDSIISVVSAEMRTLTPQEAMLLCLLQTQKKYVICPHRSQHLLPVLTALQKKMGKSSRLSNAVCLKCKGCNLIAAPVIAFANFMNDEEANRKLMAVRTQPLI